MSSNRTPVKLACAGLCFALCCWGAWFSVRGGVARLLAESAPGVRRAGLEQEAARLSDEAARLAPSDPEARLARASALAARGDAGGAVLESERAARVRPGYYVSWLRVGRAREQAGDARGAADAYREAVRLAPRYAAPRWQLGNTLLRAGRAEEAFAELRRAAESRPSLFPYTVELAWRVYGEDARAVAEAVAPSDDAARSALARFFARRGRGAEALAQFRAGGRAAGEAARSALVAELVASGQYAEAHEVWAAGGEEAGGDEAFADGGFESRANLSSEGFGWRVARGLSGVRASLDVTAPRAGARSLLLDFEGASDPHARLASQLILVRPGARYRLSFSARAQELTSGGPPFVAIHAAGEPAPALGQSNPLPRNSEGWREQSFEFDAPAGASAVVVVIRRQPCPTPSCPAFGRAWFDDFNLRRIE